jgi:hypothetical protein
MGAKYYQGEQKYFLHFCFPQDEKNSFQKYSETRRLLNSLITIDGCFRVGMPDRFLDWHCADPIQRDPPHQILLHEISSKIIDLLSRKEDAVSNYS